MRNFSFAAAGDESARIVLMNIHLGLQSTVCFRLSNGSTQNASIFADVLKSRVLEESWLHTLTLIQLEHHHPISQQYEFAIPEVNTNCICDCDPASEICSARTHSFMTCNRPNTSTVIFTRFIWMDCIS
uniref:Phlebovirus glycoprotein G2 fusion domain-containing protein n=1 Tax=Ascaris lumbricoides TaxID=6252 RepID=A0A0M3IK64_ASCLU